MQFLQIFSDSLKGQLDKSQQLTIVVQFLKFPSPQTTSKDKP